MSNESIRNFLKDQQNKLEKKEAVLQEAIGLMKSVTKGVEKECRQDLVLTDMVEPDNDEKWMELVPFNEYWDMLKFIEKWSK